MISISTIDSNINGSIIFSELPDSDLMVASSRVKNTPALDGESVTIHSGINAADTERRVIAKITAAEELQIWALFYASSYFLMTHKNECYLIAIKRLSTNNGNLDMRIIIVNKETA